MFFVVIKWVRARELSLEVLFQTLQAILYSLVASFFVGCFCWISGLSEASNVEFKVIAVSIAIGVMFTWKNTSVY